jgi:hypothetical protein
MRRTLLTLLLAILAITAKSQTVNGIYYYKLDDSHVSVVVEEEWDSESGTMISHYYKGALTIPSSVEIDSKTYTVTRVNLYGCSELTSVSLPNTLEEIAESGFSGCSSLTGVTLPSSLKKIGRFAFQSCDNLQELTIPASVQEIGINAFCTFSDKFQKLTITDLAAWCNIEMGGLLFTDGTVYLNDKQLTDLVIPENVKIIKPYVFCGFKDITSVHIPANVDSIGYNAFLGCTSITKVSADDVVSWCGIHFGPTSLLNTGNPLNLSNPVFYSENLYIGGSSISELTIPEGVDSIGSCAFINIKSLTKVSLPSTLKYVGPNVFQECTNLRLADVSSIQDYCQIEFASLYSNPFQDYIKNRAFTWMLVNGNYVHDGNRVLCIPDGITEVKANSFANVDPTETVVIPSSVTKIGINAFRNSVTNKFHTLCIKGHIAEMGEYAFGSCPFISTIYMEDENPSAIPDNTFTNFYVPSTGSLGADYNYKHTKLMVPTGTKAKYESTDGWKLFENIEEYDVTAVRNAGMTNAVTTQYTLDGRLAGPDYKGIVLERMPDGTVRKSIRK